ncbi:MAG: trypsin-like peptidase domain-containing protein [Pirellulales bacterium]|nr:trypsin-like peptidase domain-containing protein [Pirellulales bacterium]
MFIRASRKGIEALSIFTILTVALGLMNSSTARAADFDLPTLIEQVKPSVAMIEVLEKGKRISSGSGFLVNEKGMVATNYHVIEGAKEIRVTFPGVEKGKSHKALGYLGFVQSKDIAVIVLDPKDIFGDKKDKKDAKAKKDKDKEKEGEEEVKRKLKPLPMADKRPRQGETVVAYGAPLGISDTVTTGVVSAVRPGKEVRKMLLDMYGGKFDLYGKGLGYDDEATWIHMTAPISPGNSGGPLINTKGEVVGLNTWHLPRGQNMNFAISIEHVKKFVEGAGTNVQSFANLPPPREKHAPGMIADGKKTLEFWKDLNRAKNELDKDLEVCERQLEKLPVVDPRNPMKNKNRRDKLIARNFRQYGDAYSKYASAISSLDNKNVDFDLIELVVADTVIAKKIDESCGRVASSATAHSALGGLNWEFELAALKQISSEINTQREVLRVNLGIKYDLSFPTQQETVEEDKKLAREGKKPGAKTTAGANGERSKMRTWTDSTGKHQIRAKCIGVKDGNVKLELANGKVITVPLEKLSEADKRFLASTE